MSENGTPTGTILEIKGVVIDARFPEGHLPAIYNALHIPREDGTTLVAEVQQHLGDDKVRAVAFDATDGLGRGTTVIDSGAPISVPVFIWSIALISERSASCRSVFGPE